MVIGCGQRKTGEINDLGNGVTQDLTYFESLSFAPNGSRKEPWTRVTSKSCETELNALYPLRGLAKTENGEPDKWEDSNEKEIK